ncbi:MAG: hypothetical protein ATN35_11930 [Epulopiscium sp. Nele67-Bin004]|nr:MAG: hypothetical protein ATN35_11930 [Epulopiscium sp. Nele67-Bin004]
MQNLTKLYVKKYKIDFLLIFIATLVYNISIFAVAQTFICDTKILFVLSLLIACFLKDFVYSFQIETLKRRIAINLTEQLFKNKMNDPQKFENLDILEQAISNYIVSYCLCYINNVVFLIPTILFMMKHNFIAVWLLLCWGIVVSANLQKTELEQKQAEIYTNTFFKNVTNKIENIKTINLFGQQQSFETYFKNDLITYYNEEKEIISYKSVGDIAENFIFVAIIAVVNTQYLPFVVASYFPIKQIVYFLNLKVKPISQETINSLEKPNTPKTIIEVICPKVEVGGEYNIEIQNNGLHIIKCESDAEKQHVFETLAGINDYNCVSIDGKVVASSRSCQIFNMSLMDNLFVDPLNMHTARTLTEQFSLSSLNLETSLEDICESDRKKVCLIRSLVQRGSVYVFEEPTEHLDAVAKQKFVECVGALKKDKIVIVISNDLIFDYVCDDIYKVGIAKKDKL